MKIIGVSFFWGIAATIILSVTLFSIAIYDTAYHRIHNIIKYLFFILIGILLIIFSLLFTVTGGTDILLVLRDIDIYYDKEIAFIFAIFTCWSLFIIMRYYGYVLMPEYSNLNKELKSKISRKTLYLSFCTLIAELIILWWCWPILAYVIDIKEGYDIQVKNNTRLKGAVIDSKAPAEKNKLTTTNTLQTSPLGSCCKKHDRGLYGTDGNKVELFRI